MADFTPGMAALSQAFGSIQRAARTKLGVAGAWAAVKLNEAQTGTSWHPATIQDMNRMYSLAAGLRNAAAVFAAAEDTQPIPAAAVAPSWYSRSLSQFSLSPSYDIRYQVHYLDNGVEASSWLTYTRDLLLPTTKLELIAKIELNARSSLADYNQQFLAINSVSIAMT